MKTEDKQFLESRLNIRITNEMMKKLKKLADKQGVTLSALTKKALEKMLTACEKD